MQSHYTRTSHPAYLNIKRHTHYPKPPSPSPDALRIDAQGPEYSYTTTGKCFECGPVDVPSELCEAVLNAASAGDRVEQESWELETVACKHTRGLVQDPWPPASAAPDAGTSQPSTSATTAGSGGKQTVARTCCKCDLDHNLWMCLTCGSVGCGRKQYGSNLGGEGHALDHHKETGHPVAVKLGTITPDGTADIYCYTCDDERLDPLLPQHLRHFGLAVETQVKTEKTLLELTLEQNRKFDFSMCTDEGSAYEPVCGKGMIGMVNLGNSCYMNGVMQCLLHLREVRERYAEGLKGHAQRCGMEQRSWDCWACQIHKLVDGVWSDEYSWPVSRGRKTNDTDDVQAQSQTGIKMSMFKALITKNHAEFRSMRQQDASEYLDFLLSYITTAETPANLGSGVTLPGPRPKDLFRCKVRERIRCSACDRWKVKDIEHEGPIVLPLPEGVGREDLTPIDMDSCFKRGFGASELVWTCPGCKNKCVAVK